MQAFWLGRLPPVLNLIDASSSPLATTIGRIITQFAVFHCDWHHATAWFRSQEACGVSLTTLRRPLLTDNPPSSE